MHRVRVVLILFCSVLLLPSYSGQASAEDRASPSRTILISFDGAQPEVIERLIKKAYYPGTAVRVNSFAKEPKRRG